MELWPKTRKDSAIRLDEIAQDTHAKEMIPWKLYTYPGTMGPRKISDGQPLMSQDKGVQIHFAALWILTTCHLKLNKANLRLGEEVTDYCNQKSQLKFNVDGNSGTLFFVGFSSIRCSL
ncbi:hypothetical protein P5673_015544 [Acropora cervicornis]|uniref:Uncharacterized protein n=1 Tax=Acropora cervicornis TaxID=6130 RepID=A0AAD9QHV6_ACRCE|nr:hypothetical protein P5673_015544 [Acropora cervicornis]